MTANSGSKDRQGPNDDDAVVQPPLAELIRVRRAKVLQLAEQGVDAYPYKFERSHQIKQVLDNFDDFAEKETVVRLAGRMMLKRKMGKASFADIADGSGRLQLYVKINNVGKEAYDIFDTFDLGDIVGCEGTLFVTRTGQQSLSVTSIELLTKTLHPLPDKHSGLTDVETRYRRRYADLIVNPEVREVFVKRSKIVKTIRDFLDNEGFMEVETPILQPLYGGGMALPFKTHHNRLDRKLYLRIADELYLKRLIVGGYEKVWEYCKDFRNEGMDRTHNPEFSMIELYWAYADYRDIATLLERLLRHVVFEMHGSYKITYEDNEIDFEPPFRWISMTDSIKEKTDLDFYPMDYETALAKAKELGLNTEELINKGKVIEAVWEAKVEPGLVQPTFICDFPVEISPLAKKHREKEGLTERFELFIGGHECGNAFSELNDPVDQLQRFLQQGKALEAGDEEAQPLDDDFITALTYGMPPTGGLGFGVDRLVMLLTNQHNISDVLFFPQMKDVKEGTLPVSKILADIVNKEESNE
jgi:lysyl-tRNA synthetase class 2